MPTYEYKCDACEETFESIQLIADRLVPTEKPCDSCGAMKVRQKVTATQGFQADVPPKNSELFKDRMRQIKKQNPRSNMRDW